MSEDPERLPNPDWIEPEDGESCGFFITYEGAFEAIYNKAIGKVEYHRLTFSDFYTE